VIEIDYSFNGVSIQAKKWKSRNKINVAYYASTSWYEGGKKSTKCFSVDKYGLLPSIAMAVRKRKEELERNGKTGLMAESFHGYRGTKEYNSWKHIKQRTCNPDNISYKSGYGELGMCEEWKKSFISFLNHLGPAPGKGKQWSVGRIDNNIGYCPGNVRWENFDQQSKNKGKYRSNFTGITGVHWRYNSKSGKLWAVASWCVDLNKEKTAAFSVERYGLIPAFALAVRKRRLELENLKQQGKEYSETHGL